MIQVGANPIHLAPDPFYFWTSLVSVFLERRPSDLKRGVGDVLKPCDGEGSSYHCIVEHSAGTTTPPYL